MRYTKKVGSLVWSIGAGVAMLSLTAIEVSAQATLTGCYVPNSGTVYRIKAEGLPDACRGKNHVEFTWSLQGPAGAVGPVGPAGATGPQGPTGPAGGLARSAVIVVSNTTTAVAPGATGSATVDCPAGTVATGGGGVASLMRLTGSNPFVVNDVVTSWAARFENASAVTTVGIVYAVCAPAQ